MLQLVFLQHEHVSNHITPIQTNSNKPIPKYIITFQAAKMPKQSKRSKKTSRTPKKHSNKAFPAPLPNMPDDMNENSNSHVPSRGQHHCPDHGAKPHRLNPQICLKKNHVGYCGICGILCYYRAGCSHHRLAGAKDVNLFSEDSQELRAIVARNKALGILGPHCKVSYTTENGRVVLSDEATDAQVPEDINKTSPSR